MRRLAFVAVLAVCFVLVPAGFASEAQPTVRVLSLSPLKISGSHFKAHTRIRVTVPFAEKTTTMATRTTAAGRFTLTFDDSLTLDRCSGALVIHVAGPGGLLVAVKIPAHMCAPATAP